MARLIIAAAIVAVVVVVALVVRRRRPDAPTQAGGAVPAQVDRHDFVGPDAPWLVAVFTSATCTACADVVAKSAVLASDDVAVAEVEHTARRSLHDRYRIDAVPTLIVADAHGIVRASVQGPVTAQDLWSLVATARSATDPEPDAGKDHGEL